jgi:uncharacterized low-complexity protein
LRVDVFHNNKIYDLGALTMRKITTPFAVAMGAALISSISATAANAESNVFGATELSSGYMQLAAAEMACGAGMKMEKPKTAEGACAGMKSAPEGKCGDMMDGDKMKKGMESACGAMMKGKEGACGEMHGAMKEGSCGGAMSGMDHGNGVKPSPTKAIDNSPLYDVHPFHKN